jgi:hypothetical protein
MATTAVWEPLYLAKPLLVYLDQTMSTLLVSRDAGWFAGHYAMARPLLPYRVVVLCTIRWPTLATTGS